MSRISYQMSARAAGREPAGEISNRLALRLADLTNSELLRVAAIGCSESRAAMAEANRMLSAAKPLPSWAVDSVLLSPDLLPKLMSFCVGRDQGNSRRVSDELQDKAAPAVCRAWCAAWVRQLDVERVCRSLGTLCDGREFLSPTGGTSMSDVTFCIACHGSDGNGSTLDVVTRPRQQRMAAPESTRPRRSFGPDRLVQLASDWDDWPFVLLCDGQHLFVTDNRGHRISKRSLQGAEVGAVHTTMHTMHTLHTMHTMHTLHTLHTLHTMHTQCAPRAHTMHTPCKRHAHATQVGHAVLPGHAALHMAGAIHVALGKDSDGAHELYVSQALLVLPGSSSKSWPCIGPAWSCIARARGAFT